MWRLPDSFWRSHQLRIHERNFHNPKHSEENLIFLLPFERHGYHFRHNMHLFLQGLHHDHIIEELFQLHRNLAQPTQLQRRSCLPHLTLQRQRVCP